MQKTTLPTLASLCASAAILPGAKLASDMQAAIARHYASRGNVTYVSRGVSCDHAESTRAKRIRIAKPSKANRRNVCTNLSHAIRESVNES